MTHRPGTGSNPPGALPNFLPLVNVVSSPGYINVDPCPLAGGRRLHRRWWVQVDRDHRVVNAVGNGLCGFHARDSTDYISRAGHPVEPAAADVAVAVVAVVRPVVGVAGQLRRPHDLEQLVLPEKRLALPLTNIVDVGSAVCIVSAPRIGHQVSRR